MVKKIKPHKQRKVRSVKKETTPVSIAGGEAVNKKNMRLMFSEFIKNIRLPLGGKNKSPVPQEKTVSVSTCYQLSEAYTGPERRVNPKPCAGREKHCKIVVDSKFNQAFLRILWAGLKGVIYTTIIFALAWALFSFAIYVGGNHTLKPINYADFERNIKAFFQLRLSTIWEIIFTVGIFTSVWSQQTVYRYFSTGQKISGHQSVENIGLAKICNNPIFANISFVIMMLSFVCMPFLTFHILFALIYMFMITLWDFSIWYCTREKADADLRQARSYKECSRQLLVHVDAPIFLVMLMSFIIAESIGIPENFIPIFMAGAIGCQLFLTAFLVIIHLCSWDMGYLLWSTRTCEHLRGWVNGE